MPADRRRSDPGRFLAEINVVPLVDVVLVLLIIFMVTAPLMYRGIDIDLPRSSVNTITPEERVVLTVSRDRAVFLDKERGAGGMLGGAPPRVGGVWRDGGVFLDRERVARAMLGETLQRLARSRPDVTLYLRADRDVPYGMVVEVMDAIKQAGIDRLGMATAPAPAESGVR